MLNIYNRYIPYKYKVLTLPVITLLIVIILSATVGKFMVDSIFSTKDELESLAQKIKVLQAKDNLLSTVDKEEKRLEAQAVVIAVPAQTPALPALATLRILASKRGLTLSNFSVIEGNDPKQSARSVNIDITCYGSLDAVVGFINDIKNHSPLMKIWNANISQGDSNTAMGRLTVISAWSPLPQSLGKTETPIDPIKSNEQQIIDQLKNLKVVESPGNSAAGASVGTRTNPFEL